MKRLVACVFLFLLLASLPTFAMAEDSLTKTEETVETDETSEQKPQIHRADFPKAEDSVTGTEETEETLTETEETQEETEETGEEEPQLVKLYRAERKLPDGWQTKKWRKIQDEYTEIYTCPVRKSTVYMKFDETWGILKMRVWIQVLKDGEWVNAASTESLQLASTIAFVFDAPYRYRFLAKRLKGVPEDRRCKFIFVGYA